ncbi:DNA ligase [Brevibacillus laterosporus]|uniref:DNA ligase (ATP) n=1 Tax=Brevibacillus laterosporus TaxID=1465 RepID=A0A518VDI3_BRELA|nr:RNA ligase family protein [Brevibacillus laterosporus]QDX95054.1 DNA ligase [Brevibacillus laterosporus]
MIMEPIVPFEPISTNEVPTGANWVGQVKWDGVRVLTYFTDNKTLLFNRKRNERTNHYPELINSRDYCSAKSAILDGEIIAFTNNKPSFYEVMRRDGIKSFSKMASTINEVPITYMIFDILFFDGKWVTTSSLEERQNLLTQIISPNNHVQLVDNFTETVSLYDVVVNNDLEGVVYKDLSSTYIINGKDQRWRKKKKINDLIAVVGGVTYRDTIVNSLLLGLYDQLGQLWYIGSVGSGTLTNKDWRNLTDGIKPIIQDKIPFKNRPPKAREVTWITPILTVKVNYLEWIDGHNLRQPSIQAFVTVPPSSCVFTQ